MKWPSIPTLLTGITILIPSIVSASGIQLLSDRSNSWMTAYSLAVDFDDGVVLIGAGASSASAKNLARQAEAIFRKPVQAVVVNSSAPSKSLGASWFQSAGVRLIYSAAVQAALPATYQYIGKEMGLPESNSVSFSAIGSFNGSSLVLRSSQGKEIRLVALEPSCNSTASVVAEIDIGQKIAYVGDLVAISTHPWLGGPIVNDVMRPSLSGWRQCLRLLLDGGMFSGKWLADDSAGMGRAQVDLFDRYLAGIRTLALDEAQLYLADLKSSRASAIELLDRHSQRLAQTVVKLDAERSFDPDDLARSASNVLLAAIERLQRASTRLRSVTN